MRFLHRLIGLKQSCGVMKWLAAAFVAINKADQQSGFAQPFLSAESSTARFSGTNRDLKRRSGRITGNRQLRRNHDIGPGLRELIVSSSDFLEVTLEITDRGINLRETDFHPRNKLRAQKAERQETRLLLFCAHDSAMLVAAIQGLIRAFDKDLAHSIRPAAARAATAQMMTFWKKVACIGFSGAREVP